MSRTSELKNRRRAGDTICCNNRTSTLAWSQDDVRETTSLSSCAKAVWHDDARKATWTFVYKYNYLGCEKWSHQLHTWEDRANLCRIGKARWDRWSTIRAVCRTTLLCTVAHSPESFMLRKHNKTDQILVFGMSSQTFTGSVRCGSFGFDQSLLMVIGHE